MNIPKYIDKIITKRAELAKNLNLADYKLSKWLDANDIPVDDFDYWSGCEMYVNPDDSAERIRQAISVK